MDTIYYMGNIKNYTMLHTTIIQIMAYWTTWRKEDVDLALTF